MTIDTILQRDMMTDTAQVLTMNNMIDTMTTVVMDMITMDRNIWEEAVSTAEVADHKQHKENMFLFRIIFRLPIRSI